MTRTRPPGFVTRASSRTAAARSRMCCSTAMQNVESNTLAFNGSAHAFAVAKRGRMLCARAAATASRTRNSIKSTPYSRICEIPSWPSRTSAVPTPQPTSRMRSPARGCSVSRRKSLNSALHQRSRRCLSVDAVRMSTSRDPPDWTVDTLWNEGELDLAADRARQSEEGSRRWPRPRGDADVIVAGRVDLGRLAERDARAGRQPRLHDRFVLGDLVVFDAAVDRARQVMAPREVVVLVADGDVDCGDDPIDPGRHLRPQLEVVAERRPQAARDRVLDRGIVG